MNPLSVLTRRSRLFRMRKLAEVALHTYGLNDAHLSFIQYGENVIYRVDTSDIFTPSSETNPYIPNRYVLRIHAMGDAEAIASELTWLAALNKEAGLSVPAPVPTPGSWLAHDASYLLA